VLLRGCNPRPIGDSGSIPVDPSSVTVDEMTPDQLRAMVRRALDVRTEINNWGDKMSTDEIVARLDSALRAEERSEPL
jgi:hypothetical protein